jgi:hypothetical protein
LLLGQQSIQIRLLLWSTRKQQRELQWLRIFRYAQVPLCRQVRADMSLQRNRLSLVNLRTEYSSR